MTSDRTPEIQPGDRCACWSLDHSRILYDVRVITVDAPDVDTALVQRITGGPRGQRRYVSLALLERI